MYQYGLKLNRKLVIQRRYKRYNEVLLTCCWSTVSAGAGVSSFPPLVEVLAVDPLWTLLFFPSEVSSLLRPDLLLRLLAGGLLLRAVGGGSLNLTLLLVSRLRTTTGTASLLAPAPLLLLLLLLEVLLLATSSLSLSSSFLDFCKFHSSWKINKNWLVRCRNDKHILHVSFEMATIISCSIKNYLIKIVTFRIVKKCIIIHQKTTLSRLSISTITAYSYLHLQNIKKISK
jgi:hypothetical protein